MATFKAKVETVANNSGVSKVETTEELTLDQVEALCTALKGNTTVTDIVLCNTAIDDHGAALFAEVIENNNTIEKLDLGYNKIQGDGMVKLGAALAKNKSITEMKLHRQEKDMGPAAEEELCKLWETNTTLTRLYVTLHNRKFNGDNTRGEVRNKEIARRIESGRDWIDLDPARKEEYKAMQEEARRKAAEAEALANAPISEKIASTGGPYTYKQLTSDREFWPDDVEVAKRHSYLSDEEFEQIFKMDKESFEKLASWKKISKKKEAKLN